MFRMDGRILLTKIAIAGAAIVSLCGCRLSFDRWKHTPGTGYCL